MDGTELHGEVKRVRYNEVACVCLEHLHFFFDEFPSGFGTLDFEIVNTRDFDRRVKFSGNKEIL